MQLLLLHLRVFGQNLAHISHNILFTKTNLGHETNHWTYCIPQGVKNATHVNFVNIQVADSKVSLNSPMGFLGQISHNIHCEFMVWNVNCLAIITSNDSWGPPTHMLKQQKVLSRNTIESNNWNGFKSKWIIYWYMPYMSGNRIKWVQAKMNNLLIYAMNGSGQV